MMGAVCFDMERIAQRLLLFIIQCKVRLNLKECRHVEMIGELCAAVIA